MTTDTSERGLEFRICALLTGHQPQEPAGAGTAERPATYGVGWSYGDPDDYDREYCVDLARLSAFLQATQPEIAAALPLDVDTPPRRQFLARLKREIDRRGVVDLLRRGVKHRQHDIALYYAQATPGNNAATRYQQNRFTVTRQLRYSASGPWIWGCSLTACPSSPPS